MKRTLSVGARIAIGLGVGLTVALVAVGAIVIYNNVQNGSHADGVETYTDEGLKKPIIYLYPTTDTNATVKLGKPENITVSYPAYDANTGWQVLAKPSGELTDLSNGRGLYALYYESSLFDEEFNVEADGFVVKREDTASFLEDKLAKLGLSDCEAEEFIVYWLPRLNEHEYNYIRFATMDEVNQAMPLDINPKPDTTIRVLMAYKGLDQPLDNITEQQLPATPTRTGLAVVEWGGSEIVD